MVPAVAQPVNLQARIKLVLAGSSMQPSEIDNVHHAVISKLVTEVQEKGVGEIVRVRPLVAALLVDKRIVDAVVTLGIKGSSPGGAGVDFTPDSGKAVELSADDVSFEPDQFDKTDLIGTTIPVQVRVVLTATAVAGVSDDQVKTAITSKLNTFFGGVVAGTSIDSSTLLTALRDDAKYAIDPLKLRVTLATSDQFVQIAQGGQAFTVLPKQVFTVVSVEVIG